MNYFKTAMLLAGLTALFMGVGYLIGGGTGALIALVVAGAMNIYTYWNSDRMVLSMNGAQEVDARTAPDLYNMVSELAARAQLPMPKVYLMDEPQPNAFATGRNPQNAAVAVTTGLLQQLSREEVAGVVAHELAHIKNHDTLIMTITATIAGAISMLAQFGMFFGGGNRDNNSGGMGIIGTLAMVILAPLAAMLVQMAISRTREYSADRMGADDLRPARMACLRARQDPERRAPDPEREGRARAGHGAHVHHQPAVGPADGQPVLDPPGDREPDRGAPAIVARDRARRFRSGRFRQFRRRCSAAARQRPVLGPVVRQRPTTQRAIGRPLGAIGSPISYWRRSDGAIHAPFAAANRLHPNCSGLAARNALRPNAKPFGIRHAAQRVGRPAPVGYRVGDSKPAARRAGVMRGPC